MILYFSATSNCRHVAEQLAIKTNDKAISILQVKDKIELQDGEQFGMVAPTYFWRLPSIVEEFFAKVKICNATNSYLFFVTTYGETCGQSDHYYKKLLKRQGWKLSASYGIKTVDNWSVLFDLTDKQYIQQRLQREAEQIQVVLQQVQNRERVFITKHKKSLFLCGGAKYFYNKARKTKHLTVNKDCIGCGLCQQQCPTKAIKMQNGKPVWILPQCTMCFGCLHKCPTFAINYDDKTQNHGQYVHPKQ